MKKVFLFIWLFFALNATSQSNYEKGMQQAFALWDEGKLTEASQLFERIAAAEKKKIGCYHIMLITLKSEEVLVLKTKQF